MEGLREMHSHKFFVPKSDTIEVLPGLFESGFIILIVILGIMSIPALYLMARIFYPRPLTDDCFCITPKAQRSVMWIAFLINVSLLVLETFLHMSILHTSSGVRQHTKHNIKDTYAMAVKAAETYPPAVNPHNRDPGNWWLNKYGSIWQLDPAYQRYAANAMEIKNLGERIQFYDLHTEFMAVKQKLLMHSWLRFILFLWIWLQPLGCFLLRVACDSGISIGCALCGLMYCWVTGAIVLAEAMALSDFCEKPDDFITNIPQKEKELQEQYYCSKITKEMYSLVTDYIYYFDKSHRNAEQDISEEAILTYEENYNSFSHLHEYSWRDVKMRYSESWAEVFNLNAKRDLGTTTTTSTTSTERTTSADSSASREDSSTADNNVTETTTEVITHNPDGSIIWDYKVTCSNYSLIVLDSERCSQHTLLLWLMMQLLALLMLAMTCITMLVMATTRLTAYDKGKRKAPRPSDLKNKNKSKSKAKKKFTCSMASFSSINPCRFTKRTKPMRKRKTRLIHVPDDDGNLSPAMLLDVDKNTRLLVPLKSTPGDSSSASETSSQKMCRLRLACCKKKKLEAKKK